MHLIKNEKQKNGIKDFLLILPFLLLIAVFSYYPLYGWVYAFFDYKPPFPLSWDKFVGFKWFISMVENEVKLKKLIQVLTNTFAMSGLSLFFSWFPMIFAVFLNEIKCVPFKKFVQTVTTLPNFISLEYLISKAEKKAAPTEEESLKKMRDVGVSTAWEYLKNDTW